MGFMAGKRALIVGVASDRSIASGIADAFAREGCEIAFTYQNDKLKGRVEKLSERLEQNTDLLFPCDVTSDEEIDAVLHLIQSIAVPGIGARDLRECLLLQLERLDLSTPGLSAATKIIDKHMSLLASHAYPALMEKTVEEKSGLAKAISLIRSLDPKPGEQISPKPTEVIIPDVIVRNVENNWVVQLTRRDGRRLRVNESYRDYLKAPDAELSEAESTEQAENKTSA